MNGFLKKDQKILIAGANGMVGSAIKRELTKKGYGQGIYAKNLFVPNKKELDYSNYISVKKWFQTYKPNVVIVAAAKVGGINSNRNYPADFLLKNLKIQNNIIENSWKCKVQKLLFLGSSCIYPKFSEQPIKEESLLQSDLEPTNEWYAIAKICGLKLCESLKKQYDFNAISLMPTNLYGTNDNYDLHTSHVFPALIRKFFEAKKNNLKYVSCWGDGTALREFLHVEDLAKACIVALDKWDLDGEDAPKDKHNEKLYWLNVGSGKEISIKSLAEKIADKMNYQGEIIWDKSFPNGTPRKILDSSRFNKLGWNAEIEIDQGIDKTIKSFKKEFIVS